MHFLSTILLSLLPVLAFGEDLKLNSLKFTNDFISRNIDKCEDVENHTLACSFSDDGGQIVMTVTEREEKDEYPHYLKTLKKRKINPPLVSKPIKTEQIKNEGRTWVTSLHEGSEISEHLTQYDLTFVGDKIFLLSVSSRSQTWIDQTRKKVIEGLKFP